MVGARRALCALDCPLLVANMNESPIAASTDDRGQDRSDQPVAATAAGCVVSEKTKTDISGCRIQLCLFSRQQSDCCLDSESAQLLLRVDGDCVIPV